MRLFLFPLLFHPCSPTGMRDLPDFFFGQYTDLVRFFPSSLQIRTHYFKSICSISIEMKIVGNKVVCFTKMYVH